MSTNKTPRPDWMDSEDRKPFAVNSLKATAKDLRVRETRLRKAFRQDFMREPACYVADAYGAAAAELERYLAGIAPPEGQQP